jgi:membrane-bound lytic murein transglycosylase A
MAAYQRVPFNVLPRWPADDHAAALATFRASAEAMFRRLTPHSGAADVKAHLAAVPSGDSGAARIFFETHFAPHRVEPSDAPGFLTAYYEPVLPAAHMASASFSTPLHRRPADLVNLVSEADRATASAELSHARKTASGLEPFPTREQIDGGALDGQNLEAFYVADEVERFFLQVQGSGVLVLPDGTQVRVTYDGKNGHPYTSLGRHLVDTGQATSAEMSLEFLARWLRADKARGQATMWRNKSYVFFRDVPGATAPRGALDVPLTPLRSLAIDPSHHALGLPIFVDAPAITHLTSAPFQRLMVSQDVGSAIRGPQRGDIFVGTGADAGAKAGITKHPGTFFVLLPVAATVADAP